MAPRGTKAGKTLACVCGKDRHRYRVVIGLECAFEAVFPYFADARIFLIANFLRKSGQPGGI
jgi:hypothetical protein